MIDLSTCFSGGASGSDTIFGEAADSKGHKVVHYTFEGHKKVKQHGFILSPFLLIQADPYIRDANKYLRRKFPTRRPVVDNLLRRNYYQIIDADSVYAICGLDEKGFPLGGTAWAVVMGILKPIKKIYVFDPASNYWMRCCGIIPEKKHVRWECKITPPKPTGNYAGIGMRELPDNGREAILKLYE